MFDFVAKESGLDCPVLENRGSCCLAVLPMLRDHPACRSSDRASPHDAVLYSFAIRRVSSRRELEMPCFAAVKQARMKGWKASMLGQVDPAPRARSSLERCDPQPSKGRGCPRSALVLPAELVTSQSIVPVRAGDTAKREPATRTLSNPSRLARADRIRDCRAWIAGREDKPLRVAARVMESEDIHHAYMAKQWAARAGPPSQVGAAWKEVRGAQTSYTCRLCVRSADPPQAWSRAAA